MSLVAAAAEEVESRAILAPLVGASAISRTAPSTVSASAAEPLLSYELDRLYRLSRRPANADRVRIGLRQGAFS